MNKKLVIIIERERHRAIKTVASKHDMSIKEFILDALRNSKYAEELNEEIGW